MRILALVSALDDPSARYRIGQFEGALRAAGHALALEAIAGRGRLRRELFRRAGEADLVFWQRRLMTPFDVRALRRWARRLVFDFDDAIMLRDSASAGERGRYRSWTRRRKFRAAARAADLLVAANPTLMEMAGIEGGSATPGVMIPTVVDLSRYPLRVGRERVGAGEADGLFRAVWIGSPSTFPYLESILGALREVARRAPRFRLVLVGAGSRGLAPPSVAPSDRFVECVPWARETEVGVLLRCDVGLAPLPFGDPWAAGKSGLKLLQYGAAGLPAVASPVGVQRNIVVEGQTGFLVDGGDGAAWVERLASLADAPRPGLLAMGASARRRIEERWSTDAAAPRLIEALEGCLGR